MQTTSRGGGKGCQRRQSIVVTTNSTNCDSTVVTACNKTKRSSSFLSRLRPTVTVKRR